MSAGITRTAAVAALVAGTVLLFLGGPGNDAGRSTFEAWNNGHILYFALLTGLALQLPALRHCSTLRLWLVITGCTLLAGSAIELLQHYTGRSGQYGDVMRDLAGSLLVLAFSSRSGGSMRALPRRLLRMAVLLLFLYLLLPMVTGLADEWIARRQFPVLADFETPFELGRWGREPGIAIVPRPAPGDGSALLNLLTTEQYSGAGLHFFPGDWRGYRWLLVEIHNPAETPLDITIRIHDQAHRRAAAERFNDRFNMNVSLHAGWNSLAIDLLAVAGAPQGRHMDMSRIRNFSYYTTALPAPRRLYLDNIRLSR